jgi:hypothetical protein
MSRNGGASEELVLTFLDRGRDAIERMFGRLKDFRRIATRYDRLASNYLAALCFAATVSFWLVSPGLSQRKHWQVQGLPMKASVNGARSSKRSGGRRRASCSIGAAARVIS